MSLGFELKYVHNSTSKMLPLLISCLLILLHFIGFLDAGDCEMVELLLAKGAYVDPLAVECGTPLHIAAKERQAGTVKILLDHKADVSLTL